MREGGSQWKLNLRKPRVPAQTAPYSSPIQGRRAGTHHPSAAHAARGLPALTDAVRPAEHDEGEHRVGEAHRAYWDVEHRDQCDV